jgi:hypothetical protein
MRWLILKRELIQKGIREFTRRGKKEEEGPRTLLLNIYIY